MHRLYLHCTDLHIGCGLVRERYSTDSLIDKAPQLYPAETGTIHGKQPAQHAAQP